ncbi:MAG: hypothetical protein EA374_06980 [Acholeplasmatales bacterium]|nr:MAG: hypothetical protein EA374_06980 [Acholeplasmatales bacterium]
MSENKRKQLNPIRYVLIFSMATVGILIHGIFAHRNTELGYFDWLLAYAYVPFFITLIFYIMHRIMLKLRPDTPERRRQEAYVLDMSKAVKHTLDFTVDDFKMLQRSQDFQNAMFFGYQVLYEGVPASAAYEKMLAPFEADTKEYQAVEVIIATIRNKRP